MKKYIKIIIALLFNATLVFGQGEIDEQEKIFYRNERTFGLLLNTNGFGVNYRYARRVDAFRKTLYEFELNYLKHPKEIRATIQTTNKNIIFGKLNSTYTFKGGFGYQKEMFRKHDLGGISIRYFTTFGPSIGILKPVYYEYYDNTRQEYYFDKFLKHGNFIGRAPFTMGFNELSIIPGAYGKFGFSFEYSKVDEIFHALELGIGFDAYVKPLKIMDTSAEKILFILPDNQFILTLFISYRFGKVIDTQFSQRPRRKDKLPTE